MEEWVKLLPDILRSLPEHPTAMVALVILVIGFLVFKLVSPRDHPGVRLGALLLGVVSLIVLTWMVIGIKAVVKEEHLEELLECRVDVLAVLDDHTSSKGSYELAINVEGKRGFQGSLLRYLPHGAPHAGPFTNWTNLAFDVRLPRRQVQQAGLDFQFQLGGSPDQDWIGVSEIQANCQERVFGATVEELHGYGPGGRSTGILYIGQTKRWQVPAVSAGA